MTAGSCNPQGKAQFTRKVFEPACMAGKCDPESSCWNGRFGESLMVKTDNCPRDCVLSGWSSCASGQKTQKRSVLVTPLSGGKACPTGAEIQRDCPEDCQYEPIQWGPCTAVCGGPNGPSGWRYGKAFVKKAAKAGGQKCVCGGFDGMQQKDSQGRNMGGWGYELDYGETDGICDNQFPKGRAFKSVVEKCHNVIPLPGSPQYDKNNPTNMCKGANVDDISAIHMWESEHKSTACHGDGDKSSPWINKNTASCIKQMKDRADAADTIPISNKQYNMGPAKAYRCHPVKQSDPAKQDWSMCSKQSTKNRQWSMEFNRYRRFESVVVNHLWPAEETFKKMCPFDNKGPSIDGLAITNTQLSQFPRGFPPHCVATYNKWATLAANLKCVHGSTGSGQFGEGLEPQFNTPLPWEYSSMINNAYQFETAPRNNRAICTPFTDQQGKIF